MVNDLKKKIIELRKLWRCLGEKNYTTLAGTMSFFFILSGLPLLFLVSMILSRFTYTLDLDAAPVYIPPEIINIVNYMQNFDRFSAYSIFVIVAALYSGSHIFFQLIKSGELIYGQKKIVRRKIFTRILALLSVVVFLAIIFSLMIILSISDAWLLDIFGSYISIIIKYLMIAIVPFILLLLINKVAVPVPIKLKQTIPGAAFTLLFWLVSSFIYSVYINFFSNLSAIYGALAFIIVAFLWVYLLMNGLIIGIIINHKYFMKKC